MSLMGFVYRVVWILKALWIVLPETINILRKLPRTNILRCPPKFYHRFMYIAPSSGGPLPNFNLPFKWILRRFEVVFRCLECECCTFRINWWKFIQICQYYTMALICADLVTHCKCLTKISWMLFSPHKACLLSPSKNFANYATVTRDT